MLTLLSVYSESARQDFLLPAAENVTLCARAERFGLGRDIALTLSAAGGWHFTGPCTASLRHAGVPYADQPLQEGDSLAYCLSGRVALVLLVRQQASPFAAYDRYRVRPGSIYIGSAAGSSTLPSTMPSCVLTVHRSVFTTAAATASLSMAAVCAGRRRWPSAMRSISGASRS